MIPSILAQIRVAATPPTENHAILCRQFLLDRNARFTDITAAVRLSDYAVREALKRLTDEKALHTYTLGRTKMYTLTPLGVKDAKSYQKQFGE